MNEIFYEEYLDYDNTIFEFIQETGIFLRMDKALIVIFDDLQKNIIYSYEYKGKFEIQLDKISMISSKANLIFSNGIYEIREMNKNNEFVIKTINSKNKILANSLIYFSSNDVEVLKPIEKINFHYWKQIVGNVQAENQIYNGIYNLLGMFVDIIRAKDKFMPYHMTNVANLSVKIACYLNLNKMQIAIVYFAAIVHDLGKLYISDQIINKPDKLNDAEMEEIYNHPTSGAALVKAVLQGNDIFSEVPFIIKCHHENFDGSGYPGKLVGKGIPLLSRIIRVADSIDAMSSRRAYKGPFDSTQIMRELVNGSGIYYDPIVADAALQIILQKKNKFTDEMFESNFFIPQTSLSFVNGYNEQRISIMGKVFIKKTSGEFFVNDIDMPKVLMVNNMKKTKIAIYCQGELVEYSINIEKFSGGKLLFDNIKLMPSDITFSLEWDSQIMLIDIQNKVKFMGNMLKLGGENVLLKFEAKESQEVLSKIDTSYTLIMDEAVDNLKLNLILTANITNYYNLGDYIVFVFSFIDILPSQKDKIIRILFKKQMKQRNESYINSKVE